MKCGDCHRLALNQLIFCTPLYWSLLALLDRCYWTCRVVCRCNSGIGGRLLVDSLGECWCSNAVQPSFMWIWPLSCQPEYISDRRKFEDDRYAVRHSFFYFYTDSCCANTASIYIILISSCSYYYIHCDIRIIIPLRLHPTLDDPLLSAQTKELPNRFSIPMPDMGCPACQSLLILLPQRFIGCCQCAHSIFFLAVLLLPGRASIHNTCALGVILLPGLLDRKSTRLELSFFHF